MGTGGVRSLAVSASGDVVARAESKLPTDADRADGARREQDPEAWWAASGSTLQQLAERLREDGLDSAVVALAVDGTSGTLVCVDDTGEAVRPAIMYDDLRAEDEAAELGVPASFSLAKMLWVTRHEPELLTRVSRFVHQADYIAAHLGAEPGVTDSSNALKSGYDLVRGDWPESLDRYSEIRARLPRVVAPATRIGAVSAEAAGQLGLPAGLPIISGATDGTTAFLASGASRSGDCNTTLGTTLVFKSVSEHPGDARDGSLYAHKLGELWLPGAASSTGGEWLRRQYAGADLGQMDRQAERLLPCQHLAYPLVKVGERFPFSASDAVGFLEPATEDPVTRYAAQLQGVALLERLGYEVLSRISGSAGDVYATGGGSRSDVWMQLRADVTGRVYHRPQHPESAFGAAVLAAAATQHDGVWQASGAMVRHAARFDPDPRKREEYDRLYAAFLEQLRRRGYLSV